MHVHCRFSDHFMITVDVVLLSKFYILVVVKVISFMIFYLSSVEVVPRNLPVM